MSDAARSRISAPPPADRRGRLATFPNPAPQTDYVVSFSARMAAVVGGRTLELRLRYVPDRRIVDAGAVGRYLRAFEGREWPSLEAVAATIVDDFNNEVVARWVSLTLSDSGTPPVCQTVLFEDKQPGWDNRPLLARLEPA